MKKILLMGILLTPLFALAQQPKMYIKVFGGLNTNTFVYKIEDVDADVLLGWQVGGSFRVSHRRVFLEGAVAYNNYGFTFSAAEEDDLPLSGPITVRLHALDIPLTIGYIPVKSPVFKWFLYGGLVSRFSLRGRFAYTNEDGEQVKDSYKPSDLNLKTYNLGVRFGTQVDLAMFNFDFNYTIGVTNALKGDARTNYHGLQVNIGYLF